MTLGNVYEILILSCSTRPRILFCFWLLFTSVRFHASQYMKKRQRNTRCHWHRITHRSISLQGFLQQLDRVQTRAIRALEALGPRDQSLTVQGLLARREGEGETWTRKTTPTTSNGETWTWRLQWHHLTVTENRNMTAPMTTLHSD